MATGTESSGSASETPDGGLVTLTISRQTALDLLATAPDPSKMGEVQLELFNALDKALGGVNG